jgi:3-oxoacyl-[acyl-carrier protein] reductase
MARTAIVTGAARGIGEAIARAFVEAGLEVVVVDVDGEGARRTAAALGATAVEADVRSLPDWEGLIDRFGVDVLVNNAAVTPSASVWDVEEREWDDTLAVNLRGAYYGCRVAGAHMRDRGFGRIVNVASLAGQQGSLQAGPHYAVSKAGLLVLTKTFAQELAGSGVTVNAVAPAAIETPVLDALPEERKEALVARIPVGRFGTADEVAKVVLFLASDDAGYVTGATYDVNGGLLMR